MTSKYTKEMLKAHETAISNYERFMAYASDMDNSLISIQLKARNFHNNCNYCKAGIYTYSHKCRGCILTTSDKNYDCENNYLGETKIHNNNRLVSNLKLHDCERYKREEIIEMFSQRLLALVNVAEYNLSKKD